MKFIKPIITSTGHEFSLKTVSTENIFFIHKYSGYVYFVRNGQFCLRDELEIVVKVLGEVKKEDIDEILKLSANHK